MLLYKCRWNNSAKQLRLSVVYCILWKSYENWYQMQKISTHLMYRQLKHKSCESSAHMHIPGPTKVETMNKGKKTRRAFERVARQVGLLRLGPQVPPSGWDWRPPLRLYTNAHGASWPILRDQSERWRFVLVWPCSCWSSLLSRSPTPPGTARTMRSPAFGTCVATRA